MSEIFSEKVIGGRRTYFFDVKETKEGSKYLVIGEVTQVGDELERHRVMVFEENMESFCSGLGKAIEFIGTETNSLGATSRSRRRGEAACSKCGRGFNSDAESLIDILERIEDSVNDIREHFK